VSLDMIVSVGNAAAVAIPRRRAATAFHEAGHAVVAFHLRMPVRDVSILASGDAEGRVLHYAFPSWFQPDIETGARAEKLIADRVLIALAGREAERRFSGRYNNAGASHDMAAAAELAMHVNSSAEATEAYLASLQIRARDLVSGDAMCGYRWNNSPTT
jgi:ATP-dependent Zn protease